MHAWQRAWHDLGLPADEAVHRRLVDCWSEPHRAYHTMQHLGECMALFDGVRALAHAPGEVALGLWFHDAFYDVHRDDNELRSAQWAAQSVRDAGGDEALATRVLALVMATTHQAVPEGADAKLLVDIDLAILGADRVRFDESDVQIRREYAHVPDADFRAGRRRVLGRFLARPHLYGTEHFRNLLEARARANLQRALARLEA
nr:N-methyl-D-aspartate receptor NMDAR2C subunit [Caenimonas aquaedulcis]